MLFGRNVRSASEIVCADQPVWQRQLPARSIRQRKRDRFGSEKLPRRGAGNSTTRLLAAREPRTKDYRDGKRALVGTTLYPARQETPVQTLEAQRRPLPTDGAAFCQRLDAMRIDELLEAVG
jgi:hypothetical protein